MIVFYDIQKVPKMTKMPNVPKILEGFQSLFNFRHFSSF
jgi:chemotaxis signal transduction protein